MITFFLSQHPKPFQHSLGQEMGQLSAVSPVRLHLIAIFLRNQAWRGNYALCSVFDYLVMQPETEITGLIYGVNPVPPVAVQYLPQCFPFPGDTAAE